MAKLRTGSSPRFEQLLDKFYYNSVVLLDSRLMRLGEHQLDQLVLHRAGLVAHLRLRLAKWRGARQAANEHGRALYAVEAPAQWPGVALSKASQWLLAISRLGRGPGSRLVLDKLYYSAVFLANSRLMRPAGHQLDRLVLHQAGLAAALRGLRSEALRLAQAVALEAVEALEALARMLRSTLSLVSQAVALKAAISN